MRIASLETEVRALPIWQERASDLQAEIEMSEKQLADLQASLQEIADHREALEATKARLDDFTRLTTEAEVKVRTLDAQFVEARTAADRAMTAQAVVQTTEAGHQAYLDAQATLERLEKEQKARDHLRDAIQECSTELARAQERQSTLVSELEAITAAEVEIEAMRPHVEIQEQLEKELGEAHRTATELAVTKQRLEQERARLAEMESRLSEVRAGLDELAQVRGEVGTLQPELETLAREREGLSSSIIAHQTELHQLYDQTAQAANRLADVRQRLEQERVHLSSMEARLSEIRAGLDELAQVRHRISILRPELGALDKEREGLSSRIVVRQTELKQFEEQAARITQRLSETERRMAQERARLDDAESKLSQVQAGLGELIEVENKITVLQPELEALGKERDALSVRAVAHQTELDQLREYTAQAAGRLVDTQQKLEQEQTQLADMESRLLGLQDDLDELARIQERAETLRVELEPLDTQHGSLTSEIATYQAELEQLHAQTAVIESTEKAECPVCGGPLTLKHRSELLHRNRVRQCNLEAALEELGSHQAEVEVIRGQKRQALHELEEWIRELPRPAEAADLSRLIDTQRQTVIDVEAQAVSEQANLSANQKRLDEIKIVLDELQTRQVEVEAIWTQNRQTLHDLEGRVKKLPRPADAENLSAQMDTQRIAVAEMEALAITERADLSTNQKLLDETKTAMDELLSRQSEVETICDQKGQGLHDLEQRIEKLPRPADADNLSAQIDAQRGTVTEIEASVSAEQTDLSANQERLKKTEVALSGLQSRQSEVETAWDQKRQALHDLEERVKELPRPGEAEDLSTQITAQQEALSSIASTVSELADGPERVERLVVELETLGDPRRVYRRAADIAGRRSEVEERLAAVSDSINGLSSEIAVLDEKLAPYEDLDERWETERATRDAHTSDHQRYLEHVREADTLEQRQNDATALEETLSIARVEYDHLAGERDHVVEAYDADAYIEATRAYTEMRDETATLEERLRQYRGQFDQAQAQIDQLNRVQQDLVSVRGEWEAMEDLLRLLEHIRNVLRDAGPKVTQALVEVISIQAARLYTDIMADHTARLRWTEDYDIVLTSGGRERSFQQLSGGEQMAAALSVRLALLREVSSIDVAFFDEPTANLDDRRRDNLAEQILKVKGFSQLFVISHDDTFERDTDNVIRLIKENGVSQAVLL